MRTSFATISRPAHVVAALGLLVAGCNNDSSSPVPVAAVVIEPASATRTVGETVQFIATAQAANGAPITGRPVSWESSNQSVATISTDGVATTVGFGNTTITATIDGVQESATLDVVVGVASVTITPERDTIGVGKAAQLNVLLLDSNGGTVTGRTPTWTVSPQGIASVSPTGLVTGIAEGVATLTATIDGTSDAAVIQVEDPCSTLLSQPIALGDVVQGQLESNDCRLDDDSRLDGYRLVLTSTTDVQIDLASTAFDTYLILLEETSSGLVEVAFNDDIDTNAGITDSRLVETLEAGRIYHILANSFDPNQFGAYTLTVAQSSIVAGARAEGAAAVTSSKSRVKAPFRELWPRK